MAGHEEISQLFSNKYEQFYNSVPYQSNLFEKNKGKLSDTVLNENYVSYCVSVDGVVNAVKLLTSGKSGGEEDLNSDHLINVPHRLIVILSQIINLMIVHIMCSKTCLLVS